VRKTRKVTLQIEHREISLSTVKGGVARPSQRPARQPARTACEPGIPSTCPACGAARVLPLAAALAEPGFTLELLQQSVAGRRIHLGQTPSGEWWVCKLSLKSQ
jgi:hypothetical protein